MVAKIIKVFECYAGYGGASFALKKAGIPYETVGFSEISKGAIDLYNLNHWKRQRMGDGLSYAKGKYPEHLKVLPKNYGDITKIDASKLPDFDLITGGFPCQDVSIAGLRDLSKGRTKTVFKMLEIIRMKKPKYCLLENVKGLLSMLDGKLLAEIRRQLMSMGYGVSYKVLNSREHGVPQNRERVWICAEMGKSMFGFSPFPKKEELKIFVKDILEDTPDERHYLTDSNLKSMARGLDRRGKKLFNNLGIQRGVANCLTTHDPKRALHDTTIICASRGRNPDDQSDRTPGAPTEQILEYREDGCSNCLTTVQKDNYLQHEDKLRTLTPRECFRLMGFLDDDIEFGDLSNSRLYSAAGNGWDINVVSKIFEIWFKEIRVP